MREYKQKVEYFAGLIEATLLDYAPDCQCVLEDLSRELQLSPSEARELLYSVVKKLNAASFPAVNTLEMVVTGDCNMKCDYCFARPLSRRSMDVTTARKAVDFLIDYSRDSKNLSLIYFGGEPLLNLPVMLASSNYALEAAHRHRKEVSFSATSNCTLVTPRTAEELAAHHISILVSIDGLGNSHDRHRRDKSGLGTFSRVWEALQVLKETQGLVGVRMTVMPDNIAALWDDFMALVDTGVSLFIIGRATEQPWTAVDTVAFTEQLKRIRVWQKRSGRVDLRVQGIECRDAAGFFGCSAGRQEVAVSPEGTLFGCSKIMSLSSNQTVGRLGDVYTGITNLRLRLELAICARLVENCEALGIAADYEGGCFASNYSETSDLFDPSRETFDYYKLKRSILGSEKGIGHVQ
jgi:uncharacterized protein